jgi:hypothetical protein
VGAELADKEGVPKGPNLGTVEEGSDIRDAVRAPVGGDDAVAIEEGAQLGCHVGVVARVEQPHKGVVTDDQVEVQGRPPCAKGRCLVDKTGDIRRQHGNVRPALIEREEHAHAIGKSGPEDLLGDVLRGQERSGAGDSFNLEAKVEEVEVCRGRGIEGRWQDRNTPGELRAGVEAHDPRGWR